MSTFDVETLWSIPRVGRPVASEHWIVFPVTTWDSARTSTVTRLWRSRPDGGDRRALTHSIDASRPALSPDGRTLALVRPVGGVGRLHVMSMAGGEPVAISGIDHRVIGGKWSPDGSRMYVVADVAGDVNGAPGVHVSDGSLYRYWDRWLTDGTRPHIFEFEVATSTVRDLTPSQQKWMRWDNTDDPLEDIDVSATSLAYCASRPDVDDREMRWSVFSIDLATGVETESTPWLDGHAHRPRYHPGGHLTAGIQASPHHYADRMRIMSVDGDGPGDELDFGGWDRSPNAWEWNEDGSLLLLAEDRGRMPLFLWQGGRPQALTTTGSVSGFARAGDKVVVTHHSLSQPPEVGIIGQEGLEYITDFTAEVMKSVSLPEVRELAVVGSDSHPVQVFVIGAGENPKPLVHMIHGGPHGIFGDQWHWRWNAAVFAGQDYAVALTNFAGSTSFGEDLTKSIHGAWGDRPTIDIEAVTDHLIASGVADPDRMAITGGSYGGYLVSWLITQTDRYRCAIAHAAVTDLPAMYGSDVTMGLDLAFGAHAWEDIDRVQRWSPLVHAGSITTPTLVIHGDRDYRVPVGQGLSLYGMLRAKDVPTRLVHFDDEGHWILEPSRSILWYDEVTEWLNRWLR